MTIQNIIFRISSIKPGAVISEWYNEAMRNHVLRMVRSRDFRDGCRAAYVGLSLPVLVILGIIDPATGWRSPAWLVSVSALAGMIAALAVYILKRRSRSVGAGAPGDVLAEQADDIPEGVFELVRQGRKIRAVRRYRELRQDLSLKEAKEIIDRI